jgi:hypothetical protein
LTNQNCQAGVLGKLPAVVFAAVAVAVVLDEDLHAVSSATAAALALTSPVPVRSVRRDGPSFMFSVSIASSTLGSTSLIAILQYTGEHAVPGRHRAARGLCHPGRRAEGQDRHAGKHRDYPASRHRPPPGASPIRIGPPPRPHRPPGPTAATEGALPE